MRMGEKGSRGWSRSDVRRGLCERDKYPHVKALDAYSNMKSRKYKCNTTVNL